MSKKQDDREFRGTFAPVYLHDLVEADKLSITAAWLAMVIDSLSKRRGGCYASNDYLGEKIHKGERQIQRLLEELEGEGLLESWWDGEQRYLRIAYEGSRKKRKNAYAAKSRHDKSDASDTTNLTPQTRQKCRTSSNRGVENGERDANASHAGACRQRLFESERSFDESLDEVRATKFCKAVNEFHARYQPERKRILVSKSLASFARLRKQYPAEFLDRVLDWYLTNMGRKFVKRVFAADTFEEHFEKLADIMAGKVLAPIEDEEDIIN